MFLVLQPVWSAKKKQTQKCALLKLVSPEDSHSGGDHRKDLRCSRVAHGLSDKLRLHLDCCLTFSRRKTPHWAGVLPVTPKPLLSAEVQQSRSQLRETGRLKSLRLSLIITHKPILVQISSHQRPSGKRVFPQVIISISIRSAYLLVPCSWYCLTLKIIHRATAKNCLCVAESNLRKWRRQLPEVTERDARWGKRQVDRTWSAVYITD